MSLQLWAHAGVTENHLSDVVAVVLFSYSRPSHEDSQYYALEHPDECQRSITTRHFLITLFSLLTLRLDYLTSPTDSARRWVPILRRNIQGGKTAISRASPATMLNSVC